jgi:thioredoxin reductase (NADPH)
MEPHKLVIIGSGPAGYTAAIYAARANLSPLLFEGFMSGPAGGQLMTTTDVENYPGFPDGILGPVMMDAFKNQALRFGTTILTEDVTSVDLSKRPFKIEATKTHLAHAVIIATGAYAKRLDIPGTRDGELWQKGVSACAICDGAAPIFRGKTLFVVGGGDSAVEEAIFLTKYANKVFIVHRRDELRASKIMAQRALSHSKVEILWDSVVEEVKGNSAVTSVVIKNLKTNQLEEKEAGGLFFAIGHAPNTDFLKKQVDLHDNGYIKVQPGRSFTSVEGVFAAGDVYDFNYRQAVTAAGSGCMAAIDAERWLAENNLSE